MIMDEKTKGEGLWKRQEMASHENPACCMYSYFMIYISIVSMLNRNILFLF